MKGRVGQRVFWHGGFPRPWRQGKIIAIGTYRHEILWDNGSTTHTNRNHLMGVSQFGKCCAYCKELKEHGITIDSPTTVTPKEATS